MKNNALDLNTIATYNEKLDKYIVEENLEYIRNCQISGIDLNKIVEDSINKCLKSINLNIILYCGRNEKKFDNLINIFEDKISKIPYYKKEDKVFQKRYTFTNLKSSIRIIY